MSLHDLQRERAEHARTLLRIPAEPGHETKSSLHVHQTSETLTTDPSSCSSRSSSASSSPKSRISVARNSADVNLTSSRERENAGIASSTPSPSRVSASSSVTFAFTLASTSKKTQNDTHKHTERAKTAESGTSSLRVACPTSTTCRGQRCNARTTAPPRSGPGTGTQKNTPAPSLALEAQIQCSTSRLRGGASSHTTTSITPVPVSTLTVSIASDDCEKSASRSHDSSAAAGPGRSPLKSALASLSTASGNRRNSASTSESSSVVELRKLLGDEYEAPLTAKNFQEFVLKHEFGDESIQFYNRVQKFRLTSDHDKSVDMVREIYNEHLAEDSPNEINISGDLRTNIVRDIQQILRREEPMTPTEARGHACFDDMLNLESQIISKTVFGEAIAEVERLLYQNSLPKFIKHSIENLNDDSLRLKRHLQGMFTLLLTIALAVALVLSSITPWARVSVFIPLWAFIINSVQLHTRV